MKYSHLQTPRTIRDACWHESGAAIEQVHRSDAIAMGGCAFAVVAVLVLIAVGAII